MSCLSSQAKHSALLGESTLVRWAMMTHAGSGLGGRYGLGVCVALCTEGHTAWDCETRFLSSVHSACLCTMSSAHTSLAVFLYQKAGCLC